MPAESLRAARLACGFKAALCGLSSHKEKQQYCRLLNQIAGAPDETPDRQKPPELFVHFACLAN